MTLSYPQSVKRSSISATSIIAKAYHGLISVIIVNSHKSYVAQSSGKSIISQTINILNVSTVIS